MRIAVGGFMHETNTFAPSKATYEMFRRADSWPALSVGEELITATAGVNIPIAGFVEEAQSMGLELAPMLWCSAGPSAHVTDDAFDRVAETMMSKLRAIGAVDAVYLDLHGAMVVERFEDGEGELLRQVRAIVGPDVPIVVSLDLHANVTLSMVEHSDALVGFRTYPHVDMADTGARSARLVGRILREGRPAKSFRQLGFLISINWQCTLVDPARAVYQALERLEAAPDMFGVSFLQGFPPADIADCGPTVVAYGANQASADRAANLLVEEIEGRRAAFDGEYLSPAEAVAEAGRLAEGAVGPVVIADTQDNPGGGGDGDTTGMLRALVEAAPQDAVLGLMIDEAAAAQAHGAGVGGVFETALGGRSWPDDAPYNVTLTVENLSDGRFVCAGPFYRGSKMELGPMALARVGDTPVRIVLASRKVQAADQEMFRCLGVEPAQQRLLILKSSVHFRADFGPIASHILVARAPGPVTADPEDLDYKFLREGVRLGPNGRRHAVKAD